MWRLTQEGMDPPYPEHPDEPDCAYYMRTGLCGFGINCRFNHPPNRRLASTSAGGRNRGEYPERLGQQECQYYLKTGLCKFGATCKYHHPRDKAGLAGRAELNVFNLPLRPGEMDCAFYMRTGHCKYGGTCKFNHPQPATALVSMPNSPMFAGTASDPAGFPAWAMPTPSFLPLPRPSAFAAHVLLPPPHGVVSVPSWTAYHSLQDVQQQQALLPQASYTYNAANPQAAFLASSSSVRLLASPSPTPQEPPYPERPGQPECQYYMRTGECRFGFQCKFHHPRDRRFLSHAATLLSPIGLPLRPGAPPCTFYNRNGFCKFGPTCKFDHPFVPPPYNPSSFIDVPSYQYHMTLSPSELPDSAPSPEAPIELMGQPSITQSSSMASLEMGDVSPLGAQSSEQHDIHGSS